MKRYAMVAATPEQVEPYLPSNYTVAFTRPHDGIEMTVIEGQDNAGWTLDDYVLPRLASGLYFGSEIDLSHPLMHTHDTPDGMRRP